MSNQLTINLSEKALQGVDQIQTNLGLSSQKETVGAIISYMLLVSKHVKAGKDVVIVNENGDMEKIVFSKFHE